MSVPRQHRSNKTAGPRARSRAFGPLLAGGVVALGLLIQPGMADAFSSGFDSQPVSLSARGGIGSFTPASVDQRLAAKVSVNALSRGRLFRFTPADNGGGSRAVTVAVRVDAESARAVSVRQNLAVVAAAQPGIAPLRIAPTAFNLGVARGYESFAPKLAKTIAAPELKKLDMPDLAAFKPGKGSSAAKEAARFAPRIALDDVAKPGRLPRTLEGQGDYSVDVGGSYRVTRNLNVTAGVRYNSERDRVIPLTDAAQDSQAVYVGTQFRF